MTEAGIVDSQLPVAISICLALVCAIGSAVFSGLTLGRRSIPLPCSPLSCQAPSCCCNNVYLRCRFRDGYYMHCVSLHIWICYCATGLLTLDLVQLKLVIDRPKETRADEINSRYAKRILPLRKDGNYLLVTLLTANVAVNAGFSLLLGGLTDG